MQIKEIKSEEEKIKYNELAKKTGNIFNTLEWLKIFGDKIKLFGIYEGGNVLIGGFCLYKNRKFGLTIYQDPYFTPCVGPFFSYKLKSYVSLLRKWKEVISIMAQAIDNLPYDVVSFSLNKEVIDTQPFFWRKFKVIPRYTYILELAKPENEIYQNISKERRNDILKAIKDKLEVKQIHDFGIIKPLIIKTLSLHGKKINQFYLDKIFFEFANPNNSFAFAIFGEKELIAAVFCIFDHQTTYYLLGGHDYKNKYRGANSLVLWEAIKYSKRIGLQYFDFEGSMVPQIERYFRGFGGKLTPYYTINKAKLPLEIVLKFLKRERF